MEDEMRISDWSSDVCSSDRATLTTRFAYVVTGDDTVDQISHAGLLGLTRVLERRTSVEAGPPLAIRLRRDDMSFFPLLYWPITSTQPPPSREAVDQVNYFLLHGDTILFDLREASGATTILGGGSRGTQDLQRLTHDLPTPPRD